MRYSERKVESGVKWTVGVLFVMVVMLGVGRSGTADALKFPTYADFSFVVNGSWALTPKLPGYGVESWSPVTVQMAMWYRDYTGKALVLDVANHGYSPETTARRALSNGTKFGYGPPALIMQPSPAGVAGFGDLARDFSDMKWVNIPTVEISVAVWYLAKLGDEGGIPVTVIVRDDDPNPISLDWNYASVVSTAVVLTAVCCCCFVVNIYKLYWHYKLTNGVTTAKVFFWMDNAANFMRLWYVCINPYYVNRFAYTWTTMCTTTHVALTIICTLLLAMKWRELLDSTKMKVVMFLSTLKWPFIGISVVIFMVEAISSALRGHWFDIAKLSQASWSFLVIMSYAVCTFLFITGIQVLLQLSRAVGSKRRVWQLSHTTIFILISGVFLLAWATLQMVSLIKTYAVKNLTIKFAQVNFVFQFLALLLVSLCQNWAMPIPGVGATPSGSRGTDSSKRDHSSSRGPSTTHASSSKAQSSKGKPKPLSATEDDNVDEEDKRVEPVEPPIDPSSSHDEDGDDKEVEDDDDDDEDERLLDVESSQSSSRS